MDTNKNIIALGIDQGIANMGYCILSLNKNNQHEPIILKSGIFKTDNSEPMQNRIKHLYDGLEELVENHPGINIIGTESLFVNGFKSGGRNKSAAIVNTNMITGAIMLLGAKNDILIKQYTPGAVKKYITGVGDATKMSVEESLKAIIDKNKVEIIADHQSDAIAIA